MIQLAPDFVVILAPGSLDSCADPADWVRQEVAQAIKTGRNIIPITKDGFQFPEKGSLPEDIADLSKYNAILYVDAMIDKLVQFLSSARGTHATPPPQRETR